MLQSSSLANAPASARILWSPVPLGSGETLGCKHYNPFEAKLISPLALSSERCLPLVRHLYLESGKVMGVAKTLAGVAGPPELPLTKPESNVSPQFLLAP